MKHRLLTAAAICAAAVLLSSCNAATIKAQLEHDWGVIQADIGAAEAAIQSHCAATQIVIQDLSVSAAALGGNAKTLKAIATAQAGVNALCNTPVSGANVSQISVQIANVYKAIKAAQAAN
jgi:hypothetical protein